MAKKKIGNRQQRLLLEDPILVALKERYFRLALKENIPNTPSLTNQVDILEREIKNRREILLNE